MTVMNVETDTDSLALTLTAVFDATVDRVWQLLEDPRLLEWWWGPPEYPATFVGHDFRPGGVITYYMTAPDGGKYHSWWRITDIVHRERIEFEEGFGEDADNPTPDMPSGVASIELNGTTSGRTRMTIHYRFRSHEAMDQLIAMGMEEGLTLAVGQIDDLLSELSMK
jgi:uncharacterized protein YndB with AHSA1/START domain